jgi:hypothetical protein
MAGLSAERERELEEWLRPIADISDPRERYRVAAEAEAFHRVTARRFVELRALSTLQLHEEGDSYAKIASFVGLTRARAQQLVEMGWALVEESRQLRQRGTRAATWSRVLRARSERAADHARQLVDERQREGRRRSRGEEDGS